jgi:hypothetical protein
LDRRSELRHCAGAPFLDRRAARLVPKPDRRDGYYWLILARPERHDGRAKAAGESLGLTKTTFHRYVKGLGIATGGGAGEE